MVTNSIPKFIGAFILVILGVIFINIVATQTNALSATTAVSGETLNVTTMRVLAANNINSSQTFTLANLGLYDAGGWVSNTVVITNATGGLIASNNYTVNYVTQRITFSNTTYLVSGLGNTVNSTLVNYSYYPAGYLNSSFGQTSVNMLGAFIALSLIGVGIGLFYSIAKDYKII